MTHSKEFSFSAINFGVGWELRNRLRETPYSENITNCMIEDCKIGGVPGKFDLVVSEENPKLYRIEQIIRAISFR